jgi:4-hydroxybenzoyl-CoA thioesterase
MFTVSQRIRVEWAHCDPAGIIFNPHYYIWMDSGTHAMMHAAGFNLAKRVRQDERFRGFPLVASNMAFKRPLYFGDVTVLTSKVENFGNTSFVVSHEFRQGDDPAPVASGKEVRVWGYSDPVSPEKLIAQVVPEELKALLSVNESKDVSV